jgi:hypothetical protein
VQRQSGEDVPFRKGELMRRVMLSVVAAVAVAAVPVAPSLAGSKTRSVKVPPPYCDKSKCPEDQLLAYLDCVLAETLTGKNPFRCKYASKK